MMHYKKRVGFLIFSTLLILVTLVPSVFALLESFYSIAYTTTDLAAFYQNYSTWVDFIVFFFIIASISRLVFGKLYGDKGKEEPPALKGLYLGMGLFGGLSLTLLGRYYGSGQGLILDFVWFWGLALLLMAIMFIYRTINGDDNKAWTAGRIILMALMALLLGTLIWPQIFGRAFDTIASSVILSWIMIFLALFALASLIQWVSGFVRGSSSSGDRSSGSGSGSAPPGRPSDSRPGSGGPSPSGPGAGGPGGSPDNRSGKFRYRVEIVIVNKQPPGGFLPGDLLTFWAKIDPRPINPQCQWVIPNVGEMIGRSGRAQTGTSAEWEIDQNVITRKSGSLWWKKDAIDVVVVVKDLANGMEGRAAISVPINITPPALIIVDPVNTKLKTEKVVSLGDKINLKCTLDTTKPAPAEVNDFIWLYKEGVRLNKNKIDASVASTFIPIGEGDFLEDLEIGGRELPFKEGEDYSIVCIAVNTKGKPYTNPSTGKLLADTFNIAVKEEDEATPSAGTKNKFEVIIKRTKNGLPIISTSEEEDRTQTSIGFIDIIAKVNDPKDSIRNYDIKIDVDPVESGETYNEISDDFHQINLKQPKERIIIVTFKKGKFIKTIKITLVVILDLEIQIIKPKLRAQTLPPNTPHKVTIDEEIDVEVRTTKDPTNIIRDYEWGIKEEKGGLLGKLDKLEILGSGPVASIKVPKKFKNQNCFLAAVGLDEDGKSTEVFDFIKILVEEKIEPSPPEPDEEDEDKIDSGSEIKVQIITPNKSKEGTPAKPIPKKPNEEIKVKAKVIKDKKKIIKKFVWGIKPIKGGLNKENVRELKPLKSYSKSGESIEIKIPDYPSGLYIIAAIGLKEEGSSYKPIYEARDFFIIKIKGEIARLDEDTKVDRKTGRDTIPDVATPEFEGADTREVKATTGVDIDKTLSDGIFVVIIKDNAGKEKRVGGKIYELNAKMGDKITFDPRIKYGVDTTGLRISRISSIGGEDEIIWGGRSLEERNLGTLKIGSNKDKSIFFKALKDGKEIDSINIIIKVKEEEEETEEPGIKDEESGVIARAKKGLGAAMNRLFGKKKVEVKPIIVVKKEGDDEYEDFFDGSDRMNFKIGEKFFLRPEAEGKKVVELFKEYSVEILQDIDHEDILNKNNLTKVSILEAKSPKDKRVIYEFTKRDNPEKLKPIVIEVKFEMKEEITESGIKKATGTETEITEAEIEATTGASVASVKTPTPEPSKETKVPEDDDSKIARIIAENLGKWKPEIKRK